MAFMTASYRCPLHAASARVRVCVFEWLEPSRIIREIVEKLDNISTEFHPCASVQPRRRRVRFPPCSIEHQCSPEPSLNFRRVIHPRSVFSEAAHDGATNTAA